MRNVLRHIRKIVAASSLSHDYLAVSLRERRGIPSEGAATFVELLLHMERLVGVDACGRSWRKHSARFVEEHVSVTSSISVAAGETTASIVGALVRGTPESIFVCLHDVELRASIATNIGAIAVLEGIAGVLRRGHHDGIESGQASTSTLIQVYVELD